MRSNKRCSAARQQARSRPLGARVSCSCVCEGGAQGASASRQPTCRTCRFPTAPVALQSSPLTSLLPPCVCPCPCACRYCDSDGQPTGQYPFNPNGSPEGIAALCSPDGRHLAMMPHPGAWVAAVAGWLVGCRAGLGRFYCLQGWRVLAPRCHMCVALPFLLAHAAHPPARPSHPPPPHPTPPHPTPHTSQSAASCCGSTPGTLATWAWTLPAPARGCASSRTRASGPRRTGNERPARRAATG